MKAFKFACPVCGQHINADSDGTGSQIECPTCYQKIVVPQAPETDDPKFILSAAQVRKPRPIGVGPDDAEPNLVILPRKTPWLAIAAGVVLLCGAAAAFVYRDAIFKTKKTEPPPVVAETSKAPAPLAVVIPDDRWKLDLSEIAFPETPVVGKIHGDDFTCDRAYLQNGSLVLRQGETGTAELSISILLAKAGETMDQHFAVNTTSGPSPKVTLRWRKAENSSASLSFTEGYAMKLELGYVVDGKVDGKIYLCLPDDAKSFVLGTFTAEIKKPKAPKH